MGQDALDLEAAMISELPQDGATTQRYGCVSGTGTTAETPAGTMSSGSGSSTSSLFSSTSSLTDDDDDQRDDATSSPPGRRPVSSFSSSSSSSSSLTSSESSDKMQMDGAAAAAAAGPLYELSTMLDNLPALRTGLSKYYRGRSQSFASLAEVSCVEDLAKKTAPYVRRTKKASRCYAAALGAKNQLSKKIAKKAPRSTDGLLSRARSISLLRRSSRPPTS